MSQQRSKKVKNLEEEVELIFSQDESDDQCITNKDDNINFSGIRSRHEMIEISSPRASQTAIQEFQQTPRRSCRKSIKPTQDYDDIVKISLRSCTRSAKKALSPAEEKDEHIDAENVKPKWTPAKVGRVSHKRGRKSRRTGKNKKQDDNRTEQLEEGKLRDKEESSEVLDDENSGHIAADILKTKHIISSIESNANIEINGSLKTDAEFKLDEETYQTKQCNEILGSSIALENKEIEDGGDNMEIISETFEIKNCQESEKDVKDEYRAEVNNCEDVLKVSKQTIQLIEDSDDDFESIEQIEQTEICIIYENNISNIDVKPDNQDKFQSENLRNFSKEDSFGRFLKSKDINISDLGLNPIKQEENEEMKVENQMKLTSQEPEEEMPSLIICDDDTVDTGIGTANLNETFQTYESTGNTNDPSKKEEVMETLQLSNDECESTIKRPRIVLTDTQLQNQTILSSAKGSTKKSKLLGTPKNAMKSFKEVLPSTPTVVTPKSCITPKQSKRILRVPTPYRNKSFKFNDEVKENLKKTPNKIFPNAPFVSLTTLEPKELVLSGIRKRSLSVCVNENQRQKLWACFEKQKQNRTVSFYSPANQTTLIDDLDMIIAKSVKKQNPHENESAKKFVTTRRKRSISFDESLMSTSLASKLPRPVVGQNVANKLQNSYKPLQRTKLPNFAAIHEKQFNRMENLVEHVNRKQERSKGLINSSTKLLPAPAQKNISLNKNSANITTCKPKAFKKIDVENISQINNSFLHIKDVKKTGVQSKTMQGAEIKTSQNLPALKLGVAKVSKSTAVSRKKSKDQQQNNCLKPSQSTNIEKPKSAMPNKPAFNLSTTLRFKPTTSSSNFTEKDNISHRSNDDKIATRLQRHMDMFKGRTRATRPGVSSRKNEVVLKGVRSNRRFELQMQHRKNLEQ